MWLWSSEGVVDCSANPGFLKNMGKEAGIDFWVLSIFDDQYVPCQCQKTRLPNSHVLDLSISLQPPQGTMQFHLVRTHRILQLIETHHSHPATSSLTSCSGNHFLKLLYAKLCNSINIKRTWTVSMIIQTNFQLRRYQPLSRNLDTDFFVEPGLSPADGRFGGECSKLMALSAVVCWGVLLYRTPLARRSGWRSVCGSCWYTGSIQVDIVVSQKGL